VSPEEKVIRKAECVLMQYSFVDPKHTPPDGVPIWVHEAVAALYAAGLLVTPAMRELRAAEQERDAMKLALAEWLGEERT
jgi:hypothetical protein